MTGATRHPAEEQLIMAADGELPEQDRTAVLDHLKICAACRTRVEEIQDTLSDFIQVHQGALDTQLPPIAGARTRLQAELSPASARLRRNGTLASKLAHAAAVALLVAGVALIASYKNLDQKRAVPRTGLTPGDAVLVSRDEVCSSKIENDPAPVPASLRQAVFQEYGIAHARPQDYELDYLITPKLGGSTSLRNLWPEPYSAKWNARVKDQLEDHLHNMVCSGNLDIATAQREIATDWVAAYRKYFHTRQPIDRP